MLMDMTVKVNETIPGHKLNIQDGNVSDGISTPRWG